MSTHLPLSRFPHRFAARLIAYVAGAAACLLPVASLATDAERATAKSKPVLPGYQAVALGRGHMNRLCLAATVAGKKGLMMLDTGANTTLLNENTYSFLLTRDLRGRASFPKQVHINGLAVPFVKAPNLVIGPLDLGSFAAPLVPRRLLFEDGPMERSGHGRLYDGLIGEDLLRRFNAVVDCARLALYLNTDPARKLNLSAGFRAAGWTVVPMTDLHNDFTVPCVLNGHPFRLIVDTGAPFTNLDRNLLQTAQISARDLPLRGGLIGQRAQQAGLVNLTTLQIGSYTATNIHMTATSQSLAEFGGAGDRSTEGPIVGLLGGDTLANNRAVIDIGSKALYLRHPDGSEAHKPGR